MADDYCLADLYDTLLALEETGEQVYLALAASSDAQSREVFSHLAAQEHMHHQVYAALKVDAGYAAQIPDDEYQSYVAALIRTTMHSLTTAPVAVGRTAALMRGLQLEKETLLFVHSLHQVIDPVHHDRLRTIIAQEQRHLTLIQELLRDSA